MTKRTHTSLRAPAEVMDRIDVLRQAMPGCVSRNDWILIAIDEKLSRDDKGAK